MSVAKEEGPECFKRGITRLKLAERAGKKLVTRTAAA